MAFFEELGKFSTDKKEKLVEALSTRKDIHYVYPLGLDLRPDSELHKHLVSFIMDSSKESRKFMEGKHPTMEKIDKTLTSFVDLDEEEKEVQSEDSRTPTSIVVPVSYAALDTMLTYSSLLYLDSPIFRYSGTGTEASDTLGAILMEQLVDRQVYKTKMPVEIHTIFRDAYAYGFGFGGVFWKEVHGMATRTREKEVWQQIQDFVAEKFPKSGIKETPTIKERKKILKYEGNELEAIDPYLLLLDPNMPIQRFQKGEHIGWISPNTYLNVLEEEHWNDALFNVQWLEFFDSRSILNMNPGDMRGGEFSGERTTASDRKPVDIIVHYARLIPNNHGLGTRKSPQKWMFLLAGDEVIIGAAPMEDDHEMFPLAGAFPNYDGHTTMPISCMELIYGMQSFMDWLARSRMANVRKIVNDILVIDPYLINYYDAISKKQGRVIKARPPAQGRGVMDKGIFQLPIQDVTTGHMKDMEYWSNMIKDTLATTDPVQGVPRTHSGDVSATEFEGTKVSAAARIEKSAKMIGLQLIGDLSYILASNTQQYTSHDTYVKATGRWEEVLREQYNVSDQIKVSPFDILVDYDIESREESPSGGKRLDMMAQVFQVVASNPQLTRELDISRIAQAMFVEMGFKDIGSFKRSQQQQEKIMQDEMVEKGVDKGNLVPTREFAG